MSAATNSMYPDLPGFAKENRELVYAMTEAGWTGRMTSKGHYLAKAPDGKKQITVPAKNGNNRGLKNAHAAFMRWLREAMPAVEREVYDAAKGSDNPLVQDVIAEGLVRKQTQRLVQENVQRAHDEFLETLRSDPRVVIEPLVRPWLARKHSGKDGGTRYESETTLERVWPDGRPTDYLCAFAGCGYTNDNPRSVAQHFGQQHTRKGESEGAGEGPHHIDPTYTEPLTSRYRPTERLLNTLAEFLAEHSWDNVDDLALLFLTWANDRPDIEHESRALVPMSDKQVLDRIRLLVGVPDPDQTATIESLTGELIETRRQRDEANAHLVKVERDLAGLRDLIEGIGR